MDPPCKALVLCAGFGSRLGGLCTRVPKPLLKIGEHSIAEHIIVRLSHAGVREIWINVHHLAEQFPNALGDGARWGVKLHYVREPAPRGTAGTVRDLRQAFGDADVLVHYGDILSEHNLSTLVAAHKGHGQAATIVVHQRPGSNSYAFFGPEDQIIEFIERPDTPPLRNTAPWVFSGISMLSAAAINRIPDGKLIDLPRDLFQQLARSGDLYGQRLAGYRVAIDSPQRLEDARKAMSTNQPAMARTSP